MAHDDIVVIMWSVGQSLPRGTFRLWTRRSMYDVTFCGCRHVTLASSLGVFSWTYISMVFLPRSLPTAVVYLVFRRMFWLSQALSVLLLPSFLFWHVLFL